MPKPTQSGLCTHGPMLGFLQKRHLLSSPHSACSPGAPVFDSATGEWQSNAKKETSVWQGRSMMVLRLNLPLQKGDCHMPSILTIENTHICEHVVAFTYTHIYSHAHLHTYVHTETYSCTQKHTCALAFSRTHIHSYTHTYIQTYSCIHMYVHAQVYALLSIYSHIYTHT